MLWAWWVEGKPWPLKVMCNSLICLINPSVKNNQGEIKLALRFKGALIKRWKVCWYRLERWNWFFIPKNSWEDKRAIPLIWLQVCEIPRSFGSHNDPWAMGTLLGVTIWVFYTCSAIHFIFFFTLCVAISHTRCAASWVLFTVEILLESDCLGGLDPTALCNQLYLTL